MEVHGLLCRLATRILDLIRGPLATPETAYVDRRRRLASQVRAVKSSVDMPRNYYHVIAAKDEARRTAAVRRHVRKSENDQCCFGVGTIELDARIERIFMASL